MLRLNFVIGLLICCPFLVAVSGEPQHYYLPISYPLRYLYPSPVYSVNGHEQFESPHQPSEYFRSSGFPYQEDPVQPQAVPAIPGDSRFFNLLSISNGGALLKLTYSTSTKTITNTITKYCTTSTAALITCSPSGRRRRDVARRGLFHNDDDTNERIDSTKFNFEIPAALTEDKRMNREDHSELSSTFLRSSISGKSDGRQLISFDVFTSTVTAIATFTSSLTAVCASTSGFPTCLASG